jgi:hypothetical protein
MTPEIQHRVLQWCADLFKYTGHLYKRVTEEEFVIPTTFINQLYNLTIDDLRKTKLSQEKE